MEPRQERPKAAIGFWTILELLWVALLGIPIVLLTFFRKFFLPPKKDLRGKIVLVTGTGSGIGQCLSIQLAKMGCRVVCVDINENDNEETVREIVSCTEETRAKAYTCNVADTDAVRRLRDAVLEDFGKVDILVNNAGLLYENTILRGKEEDIKRTIDVNILSSYWMTRAFLPQMKERKEGHLVFINSIAGIVGLHDASVYCITKYALLGLTAALHDELNINPSYENILVSSAHPYFIATRGLSRIHRTKHIKSMRPERAAEQIIEGVQKGYLNFTVPGGETGFWFLSLSRVLPNRLLRLIMSTVRRHIDPPSQNAQG